MNALNAHRDNKKRLDKSETLLQLHILWDQLRCLMRTSLRFILKSWLDCGILRLAEALLGGVAGSKHIVGR